MKLFKTLAQLLTIGVITMPIATAQESKPIAIALHGGAGTIKRSEMDPEREQQFRAKLEEAITAGHQVLVAGGTSLEAIQITINLLEDSPLFNAARGAVFTAEGKNELDASVMDGSTLNAGAVASVKRIKNPIDLALRVMTDSRHVMLSGDGAESFAVEQGFELVDPSYFYTEHRWEALQKARAKEAAALKPENSFFSTVGAVALDSQGNLAAGTSTGGMTNKRFGRIGDSPIIGAGTYADNDSCAVSATGHGEYFIRWVVAYNICNRVAVGQSMQEAAKTVIHDVLKPNGGSGGVVSMDASGNIAMVFNTEGMYRASVTTDGKVSVQIYGDE